MPEKQLPVHPNLEQYKKQSKDLAKACGLGVPDALARVQRHHPRLHKLTESEIQASPITRTDAQLVLAREHGFESWPKFARHIETLQLILSVASLSDPVAAFIEVACVPRYSYHGSGTLEHAAVKELIARGAPVDALDAKGRTALTLAVKACVDSYWKDRRSPDSVEALLQAGASASHVEIPTGYDEVDQLFVNLRRR